MDAHLAAVPQRPLLPPPHVQPVGHRVYCERNRVCARVFRQLLQLDDRVVGLAEAPQLARALDVGVASGEQHADAHAGHREVERALQQLAKVLDAGLHPADKLYEPNKNIRVFSIGAKLN